MCHGQMIDWELRKARKEHRCDQCRKMIGKGALYERQCMKGDGYIYTFKVCRKCLYALELESRSITDGDGCIMEGAVLEWKREEATHSGWKKLLATLRNGREAFRKRTKKEMV